MKPAKLQQGISIRGLALILLLLGFASISTFAQSSILEFSFESESLTIPLGGSASGWLRVTNSSVYEADDIEVALLSGPFEMSAIEPIEVLDPFSNTLLEVRLSVGSDVAEGDSEALFELSYTYCIGELCFQIVEEIALQIDVIPAVVEPANGDISDILEAPFVGKGNPWNLIFPIALGLGLVMSLIAGRIVGRRWWVIVLLMAVLVSGLVYGISLKQDQQAQSIGAVLCTSCVGIEETPNQDPELSPEARTKIAAITREIELLFFTAIWCQACPYAKAMVQEVTEINPLILYQLIDVDVDRDAANYYGIVKSGRAIVPAILRVDTGDVLFGIEDLEERLIALLEASP